MPRSVAPLAIGFVLVSCAKSPGESVRPADPTFANARGGAAAVCHDVKDEATPLIVDWNPEERGDLEAAMKSGVAIVHYDCKTVKLLPDCKVDGQYGFLGITKKEQVISLENADQAQANLPLHGASIGASMERGAAIDIGLIMIGKKTSQLDAVEKATLGAHCDGATHYVQSATVGAFAMRTATSGAVRAHAAIDVFGASGESKSSKSVMNKDGEVDSCKDADVDGPKPPNGCGAPVRIRLLAITEAKPEKETREREVACPQGLVVVDGKCAAKPEDAKASFECAIDDPIQVCEEQCKKGNGGSCAEAAARYGLGVRGVQTDEKKGVEFDKKACDLDVWPSCTFLAGNMNDDIPKARTLFAKACDGGYFPACTGLGSFLSKGEGKDLKKGLRAYMRACDAGESSGCYFAAQKLSAGGPGLPPDLPRATEVATQLCNKPKGTSWRGEACVMAADLVQKKDRAKAKTYLKRACDEEKSADACARLKKTK